MRSCGFHGEDTTIGCVDPDRNWPQVTAICWLAETTAITFMAPLLVVLLASLARTERTIALLFYTALVGSVVFGLALPWFWESRLPSQLEIALFLGMGLAGGLGHYFFTMAYRYANASTLAPIIYLQLFWAGCLGWLVFGYAPDALSLLGMGIIAGSGLLIAFKSKLAR